MTTPRDNFVGLQKNAEAGVRETRAMTAPRDDVTEALEASEKAFAMISALNATRGTAGSREWVMSIPARPDHDPDLIIASALSKLKNIVKQLADQQPVAWRWRVETHDGQSVTRWTLTDEEPKLEAPEGTRIEVQALTHPVTVTPAMIERAARADYFRRFQVDDYDRLPDSVKAGYRDVVEPALRAGLEPDA